MTSLISPLWRFLVTDLGGVSLTLLDNLASDRSVTPKLGEPLEITGMVPSDSDYVNRLHTDGFPLLAEGVRQLYAFRRESDASPYYTVRGTGLILQVGDASHSGDARTRFTSWDPWQYLFSRPVLVSSLNSADGLAGRLISTNGIRYLPTVTADNIIKDIFATMFTYSSITGSQPTAARRGFIDYGQTAFYTGTVQTCATFTDGWKIEQGTSVGQALLDLMSTGYLDIVLEPIYDPVNRPGLLCQLSIYSQSTPHTGAGDYNYNAIFAWDKPGRSLVGVDNLYEGSQRANYIQFYNGPGGPPVGVLPGTGGTPSGVKDDSSILTYGIYWSQQWFPAQTLEKAVIAIAAEQLALRKNFKETLTVNPAPERSPEPFVDYYLGDRVPVYMSDNMRQSLSGFQRIYGIPVEIDDNGVETVRELLVGPTGSPPDWLSWQIMAAGSSPASASNSNSATVTNNRLSRTTIRTTYSTTLRGPV